VEASGGEPMSASGASAHARARERTESLRVFLQSTEFVNGTHGVYECLELFYVHRHTREFLTLDGKYFFLLQFYFVQNWITSVMIRSKT